MTLDDSSLPLAQDNLKKKKNRREEEEEDKTSPKHPAFFNKQLYIVTHYDLKFVTSILW